MDHFFFSLLSWSGNTLNIDPLDLLNPIRSCMALAARLIATISSFPAQLQLAQPLTGSIYAAGGATRVAHRYIQTDPSPLYSKLLPYAKNRRLQDFVPTLHQSLLARLAP